MSCERENGCRNSSECPAGQACVNGTCGGCMVDNQCGAGRCLNGVCSGCRDGNSCPQVAQCIGGDCTPCTSNLQCMSGLCVNGACAGCRTSQECSPGTQCINGSCSLCAANIQCDSNVCRNGECVLGESNTCGNKILETTEQCEDGNMRNGDGCSINCRLEPEVSDRCGDRIQIAGEECDDGNSRDFDGCNSSCRLEKGTLWRRRLAGTPRRAVRAGSPRSCSPLPLRTGLPTSVPVLWKRNCRSW